MKNLTFNATVSVQTESKKFRGQCEFRIHEGQLYWHGCPKLFGQAEHDKYIWPTNANLGECDTLDENHISEALSAYVRTVDDTASVEIQFGEKKLVNERARKQRPEQATEPQVAEDAEDAEAVEIVETAPATEQATEPQVEDITNTLGTDEVQLIMALKRMRCGSMDEDTIRRIVRETLKQIATKEPKQVQTAIQTVSLEDEIKTEQFDEIVRDVKDGFYPYMEGAAGCGKSYTAEQVSRALGLDFYPMQQVIMAHQVEGYGDAAGRYIETPVYKAFAHGGLLFFDEFDSSRPEAAIVINNMLANGEYSFPVIGRVKAHPDFRCIFAGNTCGKGADEEYTGRDVLDGSTRDRLIDYKMTYDRRVELRIAKGDEETVNFMEDIRKAIEKTGIRHIVSYRATKYAVARKDNMEAALQRGVVKFLEKDEMRLIYQALDNKSCAWAKAFSNIIK